MLAGTSMTVVCRGWLLEDWARLSIKTVFPRGMGIPMLMIRRSPDRLIFNMGIPILIRRHFYIETAPWLMTFGQISISDLHH